MLYLDHVESDGRLLFEQIIAMDLEGIVCKRKDSPYKVTDKPSRHWIKVKNWRYSQLEGREELFESHPKMRWSSDLPIRTGFAPYSWVVIIVFAENFDTVSVWPAALSVICSKPLWSRNMPYERNALSLLSSLLYKSASRSA